MFQPSVNERDGVLFSVTAFQLKLGGRLGSWSKAEGGGYIWVAARVLLDHVEMPKCR